MARTNIFKTKKTKIIISILLALAIVVCALFFIFSFNKTDKDEGKAPVYSYSEKDNSIGELSNSSFAYGTVGAKLNSYPKTSLTGWKITKNSSAKSGVVDTSSPAWEKLMESFYGDPGLLNYVKAKEGLYTATDIANATRKYLQEKDSTVANTYEPTDAEVREFFAKSLFPKYFANPGVHANEHAQTLDDKIFMLNNYKTGEFGSGSVQKLTANKEITLKKGQFAKVSVWVKTSNLDQFSSETVGANVYITNSLNSIQQAPYGFFNIDTDGEWQNFSFYVKADKAYTTRFTLVLGLGYGEDYAEGTVYFDDILVEHLETVDSALLDASAQTDLAYGSDTELYVAKSAAQNKFALYNLSLEVPGTQLAEDFYTLAPNEDEGVKGDRYGSASAVAMTAQELKGAPADSGIKVHLDNASYSVKLDSINLGNLKYAYVSFFVKNSLNKLYPENITINIYDQYGDIIERRTSIAEISSASEDWINCGILVNNNFQTGNDRTFILEIVVGPMSLKSEYEKDYSVGDVYITTPVIATGDIPQSNDDEDAFYEFYSSSAKGSAALFAGYTSDFEEEIITNDNYAISVAPSDMGVIQYRPATPANYKGVVSDHFYIKEGSTNYAIDTSDTAGVVNTKYTSSYTLPDISNALIKDGEDDTQALMIYNAEKTSYGYISNAYTISSSSFAKISLRVRVYGENAIACIYLIDTSKAQKSLMTFDSFTVNTDYDGIHDTALEKDTFVNGADLKFRFNVTEDMMDADGWCDVTFYIATGASTKSFRLEMWNGGRDLNVSNESQGYVFFNDINVTATSAFTEPTIQNAFNDDSPLGKYKPSDLKTLIAYDKDVEDDVAPTYVWAESKTMIYAVYNTLDPVETAEEESTDTETEQPEEEADNTASADFWLQFSSILLVVVLILAVIALFIKNYLRRRKANKSDAKSHYKVVSRVKKNAKSEAKVEDVEDDEEEIEQVEDVEEELEEQPVEENEQVEETEQAEQTLDDFVYGDVQNFGEESEETKQSSQDDSTNE